MPRSIRKSISTLVFSLTLGLPSLALAVADHLHEHFNDEINCERCSLSSQAATTDEQPQKIGCSNQQQKSERSTRLPFEMFRLNQNQRGPLLLR